MIVVEIVPDTAHLSWQEGDDASYVHEDLVYFYAQLPVLPAILIRVQGGAATVLHGAAFARAAAALGRPIRAYISGDSDQSLDEFVRRIGGRIVANEDDADDDASPALHILAFERPLDADEQSRFEQDVCAAFEAESGTVVTDMRFEDEGRRVAFSMDIPPEDRDRTVRLLSALRTFSEQCVGIRSYRGRRFDTLP
jgi:hypothetical protein